MARLYNISDCVSDLNQVCQAGVPVKAEITFSMLCKNIPVPRVSGRWCIPQSLTKPAIIPCGFEIVDVFLELKINLVIRGAEKGFFM